MAASIYRQFAEDIFPESMELRFGAKGNTTRVQFEKVGWPVEGTESGLRYGENPGQSAALYRPVDGGVTLAGTRLVHTGRRVLSNLELIQAGKHPSKTNITDVDAALGILRHFDDRPATVLVKHNNPCGVALADDLQRSFERAWLGDPVAAFGGTVGLNRTVDAAVAAEITERFFEVVVAPDYEPAALDILARRKNLRVFKIPGTERLWEQLREPTIELKALIDGSIVVQTSYSPDLAAFEAAEPVSWEDGGIRRSLRVPSPSEIRDMKFGWLVESGVTSNSVIYVKDEATLSIGAGEQDRVGVATLARDKAIRNYAERLSWDRDRKLLNAQSANRAEQLREQARSAMGGLAGASMISDAFFPFRDGIDVGLSAGVTAVVQPGGSVRDRDSIEACAEHDATMVFTGQRSFRH